ncbi:UDP-N-acetylmuramoyl-L-alanine--D-glutamate ligase [Limnohabitans sp. 63ED37-2]|uniref:UDP-N-acetylmuramoyl-L-alanine--D-glutamate ligase n=1 Tax=Limnohabitans sp. 63ED37-2 TaxID=1678128 RepID=UPI000705AB07|nr:UDP-N-acetylmuramoyl-L-alanine--D-glutamate ligase [Limnohabitans sp. 63ED37-2]ALK89523.1 UDP-N-acetylmuramoylalanine--D-glutamate ligase [Limnohabitans sp. 63ED37-2]
MQLQGQHVLILGLGASGLAMARWCALAGADVTVADTRDAPPQLATLQAEWPAVRFISGPFAASLVEGTSVRAVFRSPGLAPEVVAPVVDAARSMGLWQGGELSLFAAGLGDLKTRFGYAPQVLAITGTNGKTTVTSLTGQLVARAGKTVKVAGNIGPTLLDTLTEAIAQAQLQVEQEAAERAAAELENPDLVSEQSSATTVTETFTHAQDEPASEAADTTDTDEALDSLDEEVAAELPLPVAPAVHDPMAQALPQVWVLELSSFQLDSCEGFEPTAATVLNISQDHLDWHGSMAAYAAAKARIFGAQALMVLNREDAQVMAMRPEPVRVKLQKPVERAAVLFGGDMPQRPGDFGIEVTHGMTWLVRALEADETRRRRKDEAEELHIQRLMPADALRIRGRHNAVNALAALALASSAGCALGPMLYGLREYRGEPHRVEPVAIIQEVEFFDDSKGTNVGATVAALQGLGADRRVVVILGGDGKGQDFSPLADPVQRFARGVVLIGRDAHVIREALQGTDVPLHDAADMQAAVAQAAAIARSGDAVLMSPACASFDMFDNYGHRAEVFVQAVASLAEAAGVAMEGGL